MRQQTGNYILVAGAANLDIIANIKQYGAQNNHTGTVRFEFGGCGYNMARNLITKDENIVFMTALHDGGILNQMLRNEFQQLGLRNHIKLLPEILDSSFCGIFENGEMKSSVLQESLCHYDFELSFLRKCICKARALFITAEFSVKSLKDSIGIANECNIPVFVAGCSVEEVQRIDFKSGKIDFLFLNEKETSDFAKLKGLKNEVELAKDINTTIIMTQGDRGVSVISDKGFESFEIESIDVQGNILGAGDYFMSTCSHYLSIGKSLDESIDLAMSGIEEVLSKNQANIGPSDALRDGIMHITSAADKHEFANILNRKGLEHSLSKLDFEKNHYFVSIIDIDKFKSINDTYGHKIGDKMITYIANTLTENLRDEDLVASWGGDEFLVIFSVDINEANHSNKALDIVKRIVGFIESQPHYELFGNNLTISAGIERLSSVDDLTSAVDKADKALYYIKHHGRNGAAIFSQQLNDTITSIQESLVSAKT